ncbi:MAG: hypothetical protein LBC41_13510 [Clostridiales bacterium]|nr:hypothetical protein [Clostridiales bacterium]
MAILAVYDTVGIQSYIFSSNKLSENVGASYLVRDIFGELLPAALYKSLNVSVPDWRAKKGGKCLPLDLSLPVQIIYQGGGNAFLAFCGENSEDNFQAATEMFLEDVNDFAPGVGVAVSAVETDFGDTYQEDFKKLNKRLALAKGGFNIPEFAGNQPITKQSGRTGLPAHKYVGKDSEFIDANQAKKRDYYDSEVLAKRAGGIESFNDLVFEKNEDSMIAIIHADGNNMGNNIRVRLESLATYEIAVPEIRELSHKISTCFQGAIKKTKTEFSEAYGAYVKNAKAKNPGKKYQSIPPMVELVGDGDDITLAICGRFAIDYAVRLLKNIESIKDEDRPFPGIRTEACAGVVLFHSHYPFSEAYKLAESCCSSAKSPSRKCDGSYIDFHLHQTGNVYSLSALRKNQYILDGKSIIRRPWLVSTDVKNSPSPNFAWFKKCFYEFRKVNNGAEDWPRTKVKGLRNAVALGDWEANAAVEEARARGKKLPDSEGAGGTADPKLSKYALYFDVLEMFDAYEPIIEEHLASKSQTDKSESQDLGAASEQGEGDGKQTD